MSAVEYEIAIGDDVDMPVHLERKTNNVSSSFVISPTAVVRAALHKEGETEPLGGVVVTADEGAAGADWANSLVVLTFGAADTSKLEVSENAILEIEVVDGGIKSTWKSTGISIFAKVIK